MWIKIHWFYFHYFNYLYKYTYYFLSYVCSLGIARLQTDDFIFLCSFVLLLLSLICGI